MRARNRVRQDVGEEAPLFLLESFLFSQRTARLRFQMILGRQSALLGGAAAKLVYAEEAGAGGGELIVNAEAVHPRNVLALRSGRLRRDTWSVSHFTERRARSATTSTGS